MKESKSKSETQPSDTKVPKKPSVEFSIPMKTSIGDILRALKILSDKGGNVRFKDVSGMFGPKKSASKLLSYSLSACDAFGLTKPHKGRAPYILSEFGTKILTAPEEQKKDLLLLKFLQFEGYRNVLVQMKNSPNRSLKKEVITDAWLKVKKIKVASRKTYTTSFASVGKWCRAITVTGQTCSLTSEGEKILEDLLKGKEASVPSRQPSDIPKETPAVTTPSWYNCPRCGKLEIGIENEELLNTLSSNGKHTLIIKTTYYCRGCSNKFSIIGQRSVET